MFIWRHDIADGHDVLWAVLGREGAHLYHPHNEDNDADVRRFLNYLLVEMVKIYPENPIPPPEHDKAQKRTQDIKRIMIAFLQLELGRNLTGPERAAANQAHRVVHPDGWLREQYWDQYLSGPVDGRIFYDGVV